MLCASAKFIVATTLLLMACVVGQETEFSSPQDHQPLIDAFQSMAQQELPGECKDAEKEAADSIRFLKRCFASSKECRLITVNAASFKDGEYVVSHFGDLYLKDERQGLSIWFPREEINAARQTVSFGPVQERNFAQCRIPIVLMNEFRGDCWAKMTIDSESLQYLMAALLSRIDTECTQELGRRIPSVIGNQFGVNSATLVNCALSVRCCIHSTFAASELTELSWVIAAGEFRSTSGEFMEVFPSRIELDRNQTFLQAESSFSEGESLCGKHGLHPTAPGNKFEKGPLSWSASIHADVVNSMLARAGFTPLVIEGLPDPKITTKRTKEEEDALDRKRTIIISSVSCGAAIVAAVGAFAGFRFYRRKKEPHESAGVVQNA